jgi:adenylosuccinate synthase
MEIDVLLGLQWGDEGKGKIVDYLAPQYQMVARFQGGPNAGHTLKFEGKKFVLHTIPSGIFRENLQNLIGNGVVIDPITFVRELRELAAVGVAFENRLFVAKKAHLILPTHRMLDAASELAKGKEKIGSTLRGIGPAYMDKTGRNGLRIGDIQAADFTSRYKSLRQKHLKLLAQFPDLPFDLDGEEKEWMEAIDEVKKIQFVDCEYFISEALASGKRILAEGAQGTMLDIDFGTYPFVTSSNTITAGVCTGLGVAPQKIKEVYGITKAYCTRVGSGPFPTELNDETGAKLRAEGAEFGATTGRPRRCGWLDIPQLKYAIMLNGVTRLIVTKMDVLSAFPEFAIGRVYQSIDGSLSQQLPFDLMDAHYSVKYENIPGWKVPLDEVQFWNHLPPEAMDYLNKLEHALGVPITMVSVGPGREQLILKE